MKEIPLLMGAERTLFGIYTEATSETSYGVIIFNAGFLHHIGPYRLHVTIARELAQSGCSTIRLDLSGKGESPMRKGLSSDEALLRDFDDTYNELIRRGVRSVFLMGLCSGADDALFVAKHRTNISGLVMLDGFATRTMRYYFNHYRRRVFTIYPWIRFLRRTFQKFLPQRRVGEVYPSIDIRDWSNDDDMIDQIKKVLDEGTSVMSVFTRGMDAFYNYHGQFAEILGLRQDDGSLTEVYYPDMEHTFTTVSHRKILIDEIRRWVIKQIKV